MKGQDASIPRDGCICIRDGYGGFRQQKFECGCCEILVLRVCGVRQNLYVFSLNRNPDLDGRIFDCLLASMAAVQTEDILASFLFVGDLNGHHQEWLGSRTTKVFLKHQVNWNTVCGAIQDLPWRNIWLADNPVEVLNEHLSRLVGRYVPTKVIRVRNKDEPKFDDQLMQSCF